MLSRSRRSEDFLATLSQWTDSVVKHIAVVTVKDQRLLNITCSRNGADGVRIDLSTASDANAFEGFKAVSILDDDNVVRSFNLVGVKTKQMSSNAHGW